MNILADYVKFIDYLYMFAVILGLVVCISILIDVVQNV